MPSFRAFFQITFRNLTKITRNVFDKWKPFPFSLSYNKTRTKVWYRPKSGYKANQLPFSQVKALNSLQAWLYRGSGAYPPSLPASLPGFQFI